MHEEGRGGEGGSGINEVSVGFLVVHSNVSELIILIIHILLYTTFVFLWITDHSVLLRGRFIEGYRWRV